MSSPGDQILDLTLGFTVSRMLYVIAERGIADFLADGPRTSAELSEATNLHEQSLYRVMRSLAALGVFAQDGENRFAITPLSETLSTGHPSGMREAVLTAAGDRAWQTWAEFPNVVATGQTGMQLAFQTPLFEYLREHPDESAAFDRAMLALHGAEAGAVAEAYDFSRFQVVVDVGGGIGTLLAAILGSRCRLLPHADAPALRRLRIRSPKLPARHRGDRAGVPIDRVVPLSRRRPRLAGRGALRGACAGRDVRRWRRPMRSRRRSGRRCHAGGRRLGTQQHPSVFLRRSLLDPLHGPDVHPGA